MKKLLAAWFVLVATLGLAQDTGPARPKAQSPAESGIAEAQRMIREKPENSSGYNLLSTSLIRRARETSDPGYYSQANDVVNKWFTLFPGDFEAEKIRVAILLGKHDFSSGLEAAKKLNQRVPDDVMVYGLLTDANVELGNYKDAETSAQWMLRLRPGNLPALSRAAHLRELFGDADGAFELMEIAFQATPSTETEERAWILTETARLKLQSGKVSEADSLLQQALSSFSDYPYALEQLARVKIQEQHFEEAIALLNRRALASADTANLYYMGKAFELAGRVEEAKKTYANFETVARAESSEKINCNRELVFYYADYAHQPAAALLVAEREFALRRDVYTLDAYSWALHVSGKDTEARREIEAALAVGIHDANLFRHAGEIALQTGDSDAAKRYLKAALELNPADSEQTRLELAAIDREPAKR